MRRKAILGLFLLFSLFWVSEKTFSTEGKKLTLILKDGKVSGDVHQVPLREVMSEIEKKWKIKVETFGKVDQDQQVSAKFEGLRIHDSLYRLFRGINFFYIEGERICLLGFGDP